MIAQTAQPLAAVSWLRWLRRLFFCAWAGIAPSAAAADSASALADYLPQIRVAGLISCSGADTMHDLVAAWARGFRALQPAATFDCDYPTKLSAEGVAAMLAGRADLVTFVREPFASELDGLTKVFGRPPLMISVAGGSYATKSGTHALGIFVNATNPLKQLNLQQLDAIYSLERRRGAPAAIVTWGQLGLTGEWAQRPIHVVGMLHRRDSGNPPGIVNYLKQRVLLNGEFREGIAEQVDRPGETALDAIVHRVAEDPSAIGYSGFAYATPNTRIVALAENRTGPYFQPTQENVASRAYPLSRQIYLGIRIARNGPLTPLLTEFVRYVLSRQGQQAVGEDHMHFIPLTEGQAAAARVAAGLPK